MKLFILDNLGDEIKMFCCNFLLSFFSLVFRSLCKNRISVAT